MLAMNQSSLFALTQLLVQWQCVACLQWLRDQDIQSVGQLAAGAHLLYLAPCPLESRDKKASEKAWSLRARFKTEEATLAGRGLDFKQAAIELHSIYPGQSKNQIRKQILQDMATMASSFMQSFHGMSTVQQGTYCTVR